MIGAKLRVEEESLGRTGDCGKSEEVIPPNLFLDFIEGMQFSPIYLLFCVYLVPYSQSTGYVQYRQL